jgi:hypothetical protein
VHFARDFMVVVGRDEMGMGISIAHVE